MSALFSLQTLVFHVVLFLFFNLVLCFIIVGLELCIPPLCNSHVVVYLDVVLRKGTPPVSLLFCLCHYELVLRIVEKTFSSLCPISC